MRVAIVCPYAWDRVGGVQSHVRSLGRTLRTRGHEVQILAPSSMTLTHQLAGGEDVKLVGRAVGIPANGSVAPLAFGPLAATGIRLALRDLEPDVVHLHEPLIPSLSFLALLNTDAPTVGTFHAAREGSLGYGASRPVLRRAIRRLHARTAVSDAARELISAYFPGEYKLTPNGVEAERFAAAKPLELGGGPNVLFLGRLERRKGLDTLIRALAQAKDLGPRLLVAGTGPLDRRSRALAEQLDVPVRFLGRVAEEELPRLYRAADVYCAPGLGGESFGIVLLEAMAAGTPVICSDLAGYRAVAAGSARLVPPGQAAPLAAAIREVLTQPVVADELRRAGSRLAGMFDWNRLATGVEAIYELAMRMPAPR
ncbi:MAG: glycosyltransferase family 4 protein [Actinomycetota bacterium]